MSAPKPSAFVRELGRPIGVRETKIPLPGFRAHGRTVDTGLLRLVNRLQVRWGQAFVSERSLRAMLWEDLSLMAGVSTLPKAINRLRAQGLIVQEWLYAGQVLPDGSTATHGARVLWCPQNRRQRQSARGYNARQNRREGVRNRCIPAAMAGQLLAEVAAGKAPPGGHSAATPQARAQEEQRAIDDAREAAKRALAELAAQWAREDKPPD